MKLKPKPVINYCLPLRTIILSIFTVILSLTTFTVINTNKTAYASDNNFADGITVDSTGDGVDANVGNNICDDGAGNCTLRAAIEESNATAGTQTINFNISGTPDFTNGGHNGYSIKPVFGAGIPSVTDTVVINGYSQPGSLANTAVAPNPLNGRLLIEIDGSLSGSDEGFNFTNNSHNSEIRGLIINNFDDNNAIIMLVDNITIQGNYIGTNFSGTTAKPNGIAINTDNLSPNNATDVLVGGLNPADRNLLSGNTASSTATASYPGTNWVFQGNYIGVAADGLTPIANSTNGGSGALSIDNCQGVIIGGSQTGAINIIGESLGHGLAPHEADNLTIEGNYIGYGYDGTTVLGNIAPGSFGAGIALTDSDSVALLNNRIAGWDQEGIYIGPGNSNVTIAGNNITQSGQSGVDIATGNTAITINNNNISNSNQRGLVIHSASITANNNTVVNSTQTGIDVIGVNNVILNNTVDNNGIDGITVSSTGNNISGNSIDNSAQSGIIVNATSNTIGGNSITNSAQYGIDINANQNTITNNLASLNDYSGLQIDSSNNIVSNNELSGNTQNGIYINASNNTASNNTVSGNTQNGIYINASNNTASNNTVSGNTQNGIIINAFDNTIDSNIVSANSIDGVFVNATDNTITGNTVSNNTQNGINVSAADNIVAGSTVTSNTSTGINVSVSDNQVLENVISNNHGPANLMFSSGGSSIQNSTVQGNKIGTKTDGTIDGSYAQGVGIMLVGDIANSLIGGTIPGDGNIIASNGGVGIAVTGMDIAGFLTILPANNSIIGNSTFSNNPANVYGFPVPGLGIDNYLVNLDGSFVPQSTIETGVTVNDIGDTDTGPNNFMNFPVINTATQDGNNLTIDLDLDAADTTDANGNYRVEFFSNDTADSSGYGEGQTYLGYADVANGNNQIANITLANGTDLTNRTITATTTAYNNATASDYGSTSEFSENQTITVISTGTTDSTNNTTNGQLSNTGKNIVAIIMAGIILISASIYIAVKRFLNSSRNYNL
jgi:CSLREA domain-containing protein